MQLSNAVNILIVEDDPGHARLVERNLKRSGLTNDIVILKDGEKALDYLFSETRDDTPLLMLLDLSLPVFNGYQVMERVKTDERTQDIPIIIVSAVDEPDDIDRAYALGCNVYITKPVLYEDFSEAIYKLGAFLSVSEVAEGYAVVKQTV